MSRTRGSREGEEAGPGTTTWKMMMVIGHPMPLKERSGMKKLVTNNKKTGTTTWLKRRRQRTTTTLQTGSVI